MFSPSSHLYTSAFALISVISPSYLISSIPIDVLSLSYPIPIFAIDYLNPQFSILISGSDQNYLFSTILLLKSIIA